MEKKIDLIYSKTIEDISSSDIETINNVITDLNSGIIKIAQKINETWVVNQWLKKAILLYFKINNNHTISNAPNNTSWFDKIPSKFQNWNIENFQQAQIRSVPFSFVRYGSYIAPKVVLMPCFVNIGAYIDINTMIDSCTTIGSCAQIGKNCHISANVCIGGVLEPLQANPVIIENNCFIGAGSQILEGVLVEEDSVIAAGTIISASTKIVNRDSGDITYGKVPKGSVIVPGSINVKNNLSTNCAVIIKNVDSKTKSKTNINTLLRD